MKRILFILLLLPAIMMAAPIDPSVAQQVADSYMNAPHKDSNGVLRAPQKAIKMVKLAKQVTESQQFYIFNNEDGEGFVIISADDVAQPILGYSYTGTFDAEKMPDNLRWWLSEYNHQILWAKENGIQQFKETFQEWEQIRNRKATAATPVVGPIIQTHWNQAPLYNNKCPFDDSLSEEFGGHVTTGCVATAMAQIMHYWCWPKSGFGQHVDLYQTYGVLSANFGNTNYDWENMPAWLDDNSSSIEVDAVATLMYHCGVSVDMNYGGDGKGGSGTQEEYVARAACNYFYYSDNIRYIEKKDYPNNIWYNIIFDQLNNRYPMLYAGQKDKTTIFSKKGLRHAFICDGYNSDYYVHFNFGFGNIDNSDGYYKLSAITPLEDYYYSDQQSAVINIFPKAIIHEDEITLRAKLPDSWGNTISAWVWGNGDAGSWRRLTVSDRHVEYKTTDDVLNMILVNGTDWSSLENQTIDISTDRSACIEISEDQDNQTESKRQFSYIQCAHDITFDVVVPNNWGNTISAWVWNDGQEGHWERLTKHGNRHQLIYNGEKLNAVIVNGTNWTNDNNQTENISISNNTCVYVGDESTGKRSYSFGDCDRQITVKAKMPADWGSTISAYVWDTGSEGQWVNLTKQGEWYSYSRYCSRLNIIFVNGNDWSSDTNQTMDISTAYDACYQIGTNPGKRIVIQADCAETNDVLEVQVPAQNATKILSDGQLLILRGDKKYTIMGVEVK